MVKRAIMPRVLNDLPSLERLESLCHKKVDLCIVQSLINKKGLLDYNNSTSISATFLMKVLIHIFVRERFTFATSHSEVWLSVLTYSLSNMWYIMCGDNMLKIDVKKTLENGEENGMIEESAIIISHSTRPVSFFCLLFFSNCNFFLSFSSPYFFFKFWISFCH